MSPSSTPPGHAARHHRVTSSVEDIAHWWLQLATHAKPRPTVVLAPSMPALHRMLEAALEAVEHAGMIPVMVAARCANWPKRGECIISAHFAALDRPKGPPYAYVLAPDVNSTVASHIHRTEHPALSVYLLKLPHPLRGKVRLIAILTD